MAAGGFKSISHAEKVWVPLAYTDTAGGVFTPFIPSKIRHGSRSQHH